jgi:O-antigen/teichoic acid export membrane protein
MIVKSLNNNYYFSSFFWSTLAKILNAVFGFISVPLLLGYFGKAEYGLLSLATACNGYMHLMDLGMNTGAVKFFSQWKVSGNNTLIYKVARTNISFYVLISILNAIVLLMLAFWGEGVFAISKPQFHQLQICLIILAVFSTINWVTNVFNQLLIADKQMVFTQKVNCIIVVLKCLLIYIVLKYEFSLYYYFLLLTIIVSSSLFPYAYKCKVDQLVDSFKPAYYWKEYKVVLFFSLAIFALSLFQTTATQSRPIVLGMFAKNGAETVADFRIIEVIPQLIIMIGGTFSSIFLPKTAEIIVKNNQYEISKFATKWTSLTTIIVSTMCFPCMLSSNELLSAYVGSSYIHLSGWLALWCFIVLIQMHATPCFSLLLVRGATKLLVIVTATSCVISIIINALLCYKYNMGSAIIGYSFHVIFLMSIYYIFLYKKYLGISKRSILFSFVKPLFAGSVIYILLYYLPLNYNLIEFKSARINYIEICFIKSLLWILLYYILLFSVGILKKSLFNIK